MKNEEKKIEESNEQRKHAVEVRMDVHADDTPMSVEMAAKILRWLGAI